MADRSAEPVVVEIDGATYHVVPLPPRRALKLGNRVARAGGPGLISLLSAGGVQSVDDIDAAALGMAVRSLFRELTPDDQDAIMAELFSTVQVRQNERLTPVMPIFDLHFVGRLPAAVELMWEALKVNYSSFGFALAAIGARAGAPSHSATSTISPPNGPSGASSRPGAQH